MQFSNPPRIKENERDRGGAVHIRDLQSWQNRQGKRPARNGKCFFLEKTTYNSWICQLIAAKKGEASLICFPLQLIPFPFYPAMLSLADTQWYALDQITITHPIKKKSSLFCQVLSGLAEWVLDSLGVAGHRTSDRSTKWETGKKRLKEFPPLSYWEQPDQVKSPHVTFQYLKLHKLLDYRLSFKGSLSKYNLRRPLCSFLN